MQLRPLQLEDAARLRAWAEEARLGEFFRHFPPLFQWPTDAAATLAWFPGSLMIADGDEVLGLVQLTNVNMTARRAEFGVLVASNKERRAAVAERAIRQVVEGAFDKLGLEKVFCVTLASHRSLQTLLAPHGFQVEGVLRSHCFYRGEFHDEVVMSLLKSDYRGAQLDSSSESRGL